VFSLVNSSVNTTLPAFAAECRAAALGCGAVAAGRPSLSIDLLLSSKPAERRCRVRMMDRLTDGQMDGRTDGHPTVS